MPLKKIIEKYRWKKYPPFGEKYFSKYGLNSVIWIMVKFLRILCKFQKSPGLFLKSKMSESEEQASCSSQCKITTVT